MQHPSDSDEEGQDVYPNNNLIDFEAEESDSDDSRRSGSRFGSEDYESREYSFTKFTLLPAELRRLVWENFCPALVTKSVWEVRLRRRAGSVSPWSAEESATLSQQTEPVRTIMAVCQESREIALSSFPDTLSLGRGDWVMRFNSDKDVVLISGEPSSVEEVQDRIVIPGFCENIKNLAVEQSLQMLFHLNEWYHPNPLTSHFPNLQSVYVCVSDDDYPSSALLWCTSSLAEQFRLVTHQIEADVGEEAEYVFCWPNTAKHPDFAEKEIPIDEFESDRLRLSLFRHNLGDHFAGGIWPMVRFSFVLGVERYDRLEQGIISDSGSEDDTPDYYDSDGINDGEIDEEEWTDEEAGLGLPDDDDDDESDQDAASFAGFSPPQGVDGTGTEDLEEANFSPPAPVSNSANESDGVASDDEPAPVSRRSNKRRIVASSDAEEDDDDDAEPAPKRARVSDRRAPIILSDSEDESEDEEVEAKPHRRARQAVVIDDDSEEGEEEREAEEVEEEDEEEDEGSQEEESDEEDEEDGGPRRPLSLVERLRLGREENPLDDESPPEDGSDGDEDQDPMRGRGRGNYAYFDEDDDGNGDESEEGTENSMLDDVAEESDGEGEGEEDEDDDGW